MMSLDDLETNVKSTIKKPVGKYIKNLHIKPYKQMAFSTMQGFNDTHDNPDNNVSKITYDSHTKPTQVDPSQFMPSRKSSIIGDHISETSTNFFSKATLKKRIDVRDMKHGSPNVFKDNMKEVMQNKYLRESMERKMTYNLIPDLFNKSQFPPSLKAGAMNDSPSHTSMQRSNLYKNLGYDEKNRSLSQISKTLEVIKE